MYGRIYRSWKECGRDSVEIKDEDGGGRVIKKMYVAGFCVEWKNWKR